MRSSGIAAGATACQTPDRQRAGAPASGRLAARSARWVPMISTFGRDAAGGRSEPDAWRSRPDEPAAGRPPQRRRDAASAPLTSNTSVGTKPSSPRAVVEPERVAARDRFDAPSPRAIVSRSRNIGATSARPCCARANVRKRADPPAPIPASFRRSAGGRGAARAPQSPSAASAPQRRRQTERLGAEHDVPRGRRTNSARPPSRCRADGRVERADAGAPGAAIAGRRRHQTPRR